jgi:hypothetical protein
MLLSLRTPHTIRSWLKDIIGIISRRNSTHWPNKITHLIRELKEPKIHLLQKKDLGHLGFRAGLCLGIRKHHKMPIKPSTEAER